MDSEPKKIKLEDQVESLTNISEFISGLPGWTIHTEETIYRQASQSFEQLIESYRYRLAGHPVAIKIEEGQESERSDSSSTVIWSFAPETVERHQKDSPEELEKESHKKAEQKGKRKARQEYISSIPQFKKATPSQRYIEQAEQEALAVAATIAATANPNLPVFEGPKNLSEAIQLLPTPSGSFFSAKYLPVLYQHHWVRILAYPEYIWPLPIELLTATVEELDTWRQQNQSLGVFYPLEPLESNTIDI